MKHADTLLENLTVFEMLVYTAELKMPQEHSYTFKQQRVEELLQQLALSSCRHVKIGSNLARGISGVYASLNDLQYSL